MKGIYLEKGFSGHTYLNDFCDYIKDSIFDKNWLISNLECYSKSNIMYNLEGENNYIWISGEQLLDTIYSENIFFIWAVFSGFKKDITKEQALGYSVQDPSISKWPWYFDVDFQIQHPLAEMEILACDSTSTIVISKDNDDIKKLRVAFAESEDLKEHNIRISHLRQN